MTKTVIFATGNEGKVVEIRDILKRYDINVISLKQAGITLEAEENGATFAENALIKAREAASKTEYMVMADDSGLCVDFMNGEPGVHSARYLGRDTSYTIKNGTIIKNLENAKGAERSARFVCAIAAVFPDGGEYVEEGVLEGQIGYEEKGENGFGYDPIFYLPEYGCTSAELSMEKKNEISHRGRALLQFGNMMLAKGIWTLKGENPAL